ncbi:ABC transporter permease [Leifsonia sp. Root112D2]|uniref:ABC transporter permease n=1 Tax=Leifsonia sp. Root112D2 TaxID=1736426 RepID=UPI0006F84D57|nr:hypothetical protein [Leifsonia sp. Root112D2]KQV06625.1 hypothetical protein ASC63_04200 [Leifsonia sp. Root112D2]
MNTFGVLLMQRLRRDRWQLIIWIACIALLAFVATTSVGSTYGSGASRASVLKLAVSNPAILMLRGLPQGSSLAAVTYFEIFTFLALLAGLMSTFLAVRHTRAEEESGRAELIASTPAARLTPTVATLVHGVLANLVIGIVVVVGFSSSKLPVDGSILAGAAVAATGIVFVGVGLLTSQLMVTSRGANGVAAAAVVLAYVLRGIGDAAGTPTADGVHMTAAWPSWLSPIGWGEQASVYDSNLWWPLLLSLAFTALLVGIVFALQSRRDSGASLVPQRAGRADARATLSGSLGLAWRLQWPTIVGWAIGGALSGLLAGSLGSLVSKVAADANLNAVEQGLKTMGSGGSGSLDALFVSAIFSLIGVLAAACATQVIIRMRQEEAAGTAEVLLATPLARIRWLLDYLLVGVVAVVIVLTVAAVAAVASALSAPGGDAVGGSFRAAVAQLPAAFIYLGVLALVFVLLPSWTIPLAWSLLGLGAFFGLFAGFIGLPDWARDLSPFAHTPVTVGPSQDWSGGIWMLAIAVVAATVAGLLIRRRDVVTT